MNPRPKLRSPPPSSSVVSPASPPKSLINKMPRKLTLRPTLTLATTLFSILALYAFFNTFIFSNPPNNVTSVSFSRNYNTQNSKSVKVYMYDLPRKFTYGVIESYALARGGEKQSDDSLLKYPGNQHSAEWYLFSDLNRPSSERVGSAVTRVLDPEEADLFYVPFFSSLSLVANPIRSNNAVVAPVERPAYSDEVTQESLIEWLEQQEYWKRNNGWDHVFICQDPNALYKVVDKVKNGVLLVSDFGRLARNQASLVKDVILPYSHRINTYTGDIGVENRKSLLFFMGNRYRKEMSDKNR